MKLLVTGGAGFIGSAVIRYIIELGRDREHYLNNLFRNALIFPLVVILYSLLKRESA